MGGGQSHPNPIVWNYMDLELKLNLSMTPLTRRWTFKHPVGAWTKACPQASLDRIMYSHLWVPEKPIKKEYYFQGGCVRQENSKMGGKLFGVIMSWQKRQNTKLNFIDGRISISYSRNPGFFPPMETKICKMKNPLIAQTSPRTWESSGCEGLLKWTVHEG